MSERDQRRHHLDSSQSSTSSCVCPFCLGASLQTPLPHHPKSRTRSCSFSSSDLCNDHHNNNHHHHQPSLYSTRQQQQPINKNAPTSKPSQANDNLNSDDNTASSARNSHPPSQSRKRPAFGGNNRVGTSKRLCRDGTHSLYRVSLRRSWSTSSGRVPECSLMKSDIGYSGISLPFATGRDNHINCLAHAVPLEEAPTIPPINVRSLSQMDLQEILKSPQLRHDIVFQPQLQLRPNTDSDSERTKRAVADRYWNAVALELSALQACSGPVKLCPNSRIPHLFSTLEESLACLLPREDRLQFIESVNVDHLIEQVERKVFNLVEFITTIALIIKSHCAPMRDWYVDLMVQHIQRATANDWVIGQAEGFRMAFCMLETMKLDVSNHQLRTLRPALVRSSCEFEQDYFTRKFSTNDEALIGVESWIRARKELFIDQRLVTQPSGEFARRLNVFNMASFVASSFSLNQLPAHLSLDEARFACMQRDFFHLVCLEVVSLLFSSIIDKQSRENKVLSRKVQERIDCIICGTSREECNSSSSKSWENIKAVMDKWNKSLGKVSAELTRLYQITMGIQDTGFDQSKFKFIKNWLEKNLMNSRLFKLTEERLLASLEASVLSKLGFSSPLNTHKLALTSTTSDNTGNDTVTDSTIVLDGVRQLSQLMSSVEEFHWRVFSNFYTETISSK